MPRSRRRLAAELGGQAERLEHRLARGTPRTASRRARRVLREQLEAGVRVDPPRVRPARWRAAVERQPRRVREQVAQRRALAAPPARRGRRRPPRPRRARRARSRASSPTPSANARSTSPCVAASRRRVDDAGGRVRHRPRSICRSASTAAILVRVERRLLPRRSPFETVAGYSRAVVRRRSTCTWPGTAPILPDGDAARGRLRADAALPGDHGRGTRPWRAHVRRRRPHPDLRHRPGRLDEIARAHGEVFGEIRPAATASSPSCSTRAGVSRSRRTRVLPGDDA